MDRYLTWDKYRRFNRWVVSLRNERIPQGFVFVSGLGSIGFAAIFLAVPDRLEASPAVDYLTNAIPSQVWAFLFLLFGAVLCTLAIARYYWSAPVSLLFSILMFLFCIMSAIDFVEGPATGLLALFAFIYAWWNFLAAAMAIAPIVERIADHAS